MRVVTGEPDDFILRHPPDFEALFAAAPNPYLVLLPDERYTIVAVSESYLAATMTRREEILNRSLFEVFPDNPDDPAVTGVAELRTSLKRVLSERRADAMGVQKYDIPRPGDPQGSFEVKYWSPVNTPVLGEHGEIRYIIHRAEDITEYMVAQDKRDATRIKTMEAEILQRAKEVKEANRQLKSANESLRSSEEKLRLATEAAEVGLWDIDMLNDTLHWPPRVKAMYGISPHAPVAMADYYAGVHPEDRERTSEAFAQALDPAQRALYDVEYRTVGKEDGLIRWVGAKGRGIFDDQGRCIRVIGSAVDITSRTLANQALNFNRARLDYATRLSGIGFWYCDLPFDELKWDERVKDHFFFSPAERITITDFYARIHEEDRERTRKAIDDSILNRTPYDIIYRTVHPTSGTVKWIRALGGTDYANDGKPIHFDGVTVDVSAQKQSEAAALVNAQRVQLALAAGAIIGTWIWEIPTNRFTADEPFARAFGLDAVRCREGIPLADVLRSVHPEDQEGLANAIEEVTIKGGSYARQYRVRRDDGRYYWIEANGRVDHAPDGTPLNFRGVLIDMEARRAVEAERDRAIAESRALNETLEQRVAERTTELMQAEEKLRQSQKMDAVGQLTGGLAHDFNNLLTGITGSLEMLNVRLQQGRFAEMDRYVHAAQGAAKRAAGLTHRLLAFARRQTLDPKPTDMNRLVAGMSDLLQRTIGPEVSLETVAATGLWSTLIDPGQLENALLNLCINARDAMPNGGRLTIETGNKWLDERAAKERDVATGQYVSLCVSDTGTGMSQETIARAFDPFFTTKPIGVGTGLGLSMVYGFARQSGGQVRIYSEIGQGTLVCLYLPRHVGTFVDSDEEAKTTGIIMADQTGSVLVVDDEPTVRMLVVDVLQEMGCLALEAADGAAGLRILNSGARIDLLITDVGLPGGMNGRQLADAARVARADLKVLFITGYAENAVLSHGHLDHGMHVLTKPFTMDDLVRRIRNLL